VRGTIYIYNHIYPNGAQQLEVNFWVPGDETQSGWTGKLLIDAPSSLIPLQGLPGVLWGAVDRLDENGFPVIAVDGIEAAYPGVAIQAWLGTEAVNLVEGKNVILFTTETGESFVLGDSIELGESSLFGGPGDAVILEGYAIPGEAFGGYPVLTVLAGTPADIPLEDYQLQMTEIYILDETLGVQNQAAAITGSVTIELVELSYAALSLEHCNPEFQADPGNEQWLYAQPVWRFIGTFDDGRTIEIVVQALPEEYLK
jgi:hypothetical protein